MTKFKENLLDIKADTHVHSIYSERPSEWILKTIGTRESYTQPDYIFDRALEKGMDLVTITDHNTTEGIFYLKKKYPDKVFTGVELTTYFPEDNCKIHLLVYGFDRDQFEIMDNLRNNIYALRTYIKKNNLAYSVAHATYSVNQKLTSTHIEKLILLFDVFEGINGSVKKSNNRILAEALENLTPITIEKLYKKYEIEPISETPWIKSFTGGSDDHAGLFIADSYTYAKSSGLLSPEEFLELMKGKKTDCGGRHSDFRSLAFQVVKVGYDFSRSKNTANPNSLLNNLNSIFFDHKPLSVKDRIILKKLRKDSKIRNDKIKKALANIIDSKNRFNTLDEKIEFIYENISDIFDQYMETLLKSIINDLDKLDIINTLRKLSSSLFGLLLTLPFISTVRHLFQDREIIRFLQEKYIPSSGSYEKSIAWFTDTLEDLNGVSITLQKIGHLSHENNFNLALFSSLDKDGGSSDLPPNVRKIKPIFSYVSDIYTHFELKIPSLMETVKEAVLFDPDEIIISTPGPMGMIGLLCAKLLNIPSKIIFHTDFEMEAKEIIGDDRILGLINTGLKWFYNSNTEILVATEEYKDILKQRGFEPSKLKIFKRGLDLRHFHYYEHARLILKPGLSVPEEATVFLYTGRISRDKNIDFLLGLYDLLREGNYNVFFILGGNGPLLDELKEKYKDDGNILFKGRIEQDELPLYYSMADYFLFPSITDTFGMSVLEAQACGLPALVSNIGGPKEIIIPGESGFICRANDPEHWMDKIKELVMVKRAAPEQYARLREKSSENVRLHYNWEKIIPEYFLKNKPNPILLI